MFFKNLSSDETGIRGAVLSAYIPDVYEEINIKRKRPAVIICPGGGYIFRSRREAEPIALRLMAGGLNAFILEYSVEPARYPVALGQLAAAVSYVRAHAEQYHTISDRIIVCGFSAGGHLCANYGVSWQRDDLFPELDREGRRPNGMILSYPVITLKKETHVGSRMALLGEKDENEQLLNDTAADELVTNLTPPAFIWHTFDDPIVPVSNSLRFACAMNRAGVSTELHIFPHGRHGMSLATDQTDDLQDAIAEGKNVACWIDMAIRWAREL